MKSMMRAFVMAMTLLAVLPAQETAKGMLDLASKRAASAKGKSGEELSAILKEAAGLYDQLVAKFPDAKAEVARAHLDVGRIRRRLNDLTGAEASLKLAAAAVDETRTATEALLDLATLYRKAKRLDEAQQVLDRVVSGFPGEPRQRSEALSKLASMHRAAKRFEAAEAALRQILSDHGDQFAPAIDALDDLVALMIAQGREGDGRALHESHGDALRARFAGTRYEARVKPALDKIAARFKSAEDE